MHLCTEAGIRALTTSRKGSWTQARSGMFCYASFADEFLRLRDYGDAFAFPDKPGADLKLLEGLQQGPLL